MEWVGIQYVHASMIPSVTGCNFLNVSGLLWVPGLLDFNATPPTSHSSRCRSWRNQFHSAHWFQSVKVVWRWLVCMKAPAEPPRLKSLPCSYDLLGYNGPTHWLTGMVPCTAEWPDTDSTTVGMFKLHNMGDVELLPANRIVWITVLNWFLGHLTFLRCQILHSWV